MMSAQYRDAHCLLFASRKETWGLPLTEAKAHGLAILAADLPYAHETIGTYSAVRFFDVDDAEDLANKMLAFQEGKLSFIDHRSATPEVPFAPNWRGLMRLLTEGL
jgi:glycosyltransferase involved in cell wall biosynthesis